MRIWTIEGYRSNHRRCSVKKMFLKNSQSWYGNTSVAVSFLITEKETLAQVFSCEFCEIFMNAFLTEQFWIHLSFTIIQNLAYKFYVH